MWADRAQEPADSRILEHFKMSDLDLSSLQQYRQRLGSHKPTHPWLDEDDKGLLTKLNGWRSCRSSGAQGVTIAGLLMFGREESLREALPQYQIDFREKLSSDSAIRWTDRLTLDGTWSGNLYQFYVRVIQKLSADLKLPFQLDAEFFRKGETVVHVAIREALVNALIHADYQGQGGIVIEKYHDRFEFSNPGSLLISVDQILDGNISECRNKSLQTMFTMIGAAERAGSGVDKIRKGWNSQHWRSPLIRDQVQPDRVLWVLPMISLIPDKSLVKLKKRFGSRFSKFTQLEIQALVTADIEEYVDNARMRQITNKHAADITKLFQDLVSQDILVQDRQGRWTRYCLPFHSVHMERDSVHKEINNSVHRSEISQDQWDALLLIAEPARKNRRLSPTEMENVILQLCQNRWLNRRQLAELLDRHHDGLRSRFLTQMVGHGLLQLRYPDKPNRVDQAYTSPRK
jgi:ATP-dependent DNA helicase RecG